MKLFFLSLVLFAGLLIQAQQPTETVKGPVTYKTSEKPLAGASVNIEGTPLTALTDAAGVFIINGVSINRIKINISHVAYGAASIPEVLVTAGKEVVLDIALEQNITSLDEIIIKGGRTKKGALTNEFAGSSASSFTIDEITRYACGRNDIVVRGNSPAGVLWHIEGLPSPGPNHFATLGTTGGPISALIPTLIDHFMNSTINTDTKIKFAA